ncbi:MAG: hypothetical protein J07HN6_01775 [Halonotius sp. J07HN6]|nr:MAG: hypothetical protein J07HN6_01775 [Halonotius sp. J07HN6]ERH05636.1 MAG: hypothetical protein J07HN4v3_01239 [Halonotius sp. J07HN4]
MDGQIVDAVTEWDTASFGGGYDGLNDLADAEFSGAIKTASTWAFMLNGNVIGVVDGSLSAFDGGDGTAYEAPDPSLPLLYTMQTGDSEKQAEYYTNDTAISEADDTLSSGNFTGYIKLSENVHSGDYYIVYYGGRSMSVAFVGNSRQLFTGDEAFERANDEIGIYRVYAADIDVVDIPETERNTAAAADTGISIDNTPDTDSGAADDGSATTPVPDDDGSTATTGGQPTDASETATNGGGASESTGGEPDATTAAGGAADDSTATASTESTTPDRPPAPPSEPAETPQSTGDTAGGRAANGGSGETQTAGGSATAEASGNANRFSEESEWQNTTTIPSLDPDEEATSSRGQTGDGQQLTQRSPQSSGADSDGQLSRKQLRNRLEDAEAVMEKAEKRHKELIEARDTARQERDEAREERDAAQEKIDELETKLNEAETEIEQLESQLAEIEEAAEAAAEAEPTPSAAAAADVDSGHTLDPVSALEGTSLFVRYDSKGAATLDTAHEGGAAPDELSENLRIDSHTTFETEGLTVDGDPFDEFLENRIEVAFADWIVRDLLYDIQGTGTQSGMRRIYDAIPKIDRIELRGTVELGTDEDDEPIELPYDLIVRDKHGNPLFVATFEESKEAVGGDVVEEVIQDGSEIRQREQEFVAGFSVTTSYFEPGALEAAEDATSGGFLSRSRGKSFVSLSRKRGFHLCLVDRIEDGFDLRVPEL